MKKTAWSVLRVLLVLACVWTAARAETVAAPQASAFDEAALLAADTPPPLPPGFENEDEVKAALFSGKLHLLSPLMHIPVPDNVEEILDIEYGRVGDRPLKLDLYVPKDIEKPAPGLVFIHGGGWEGGSRKIYKYYTVRYAARGYVAATVSYRLVGEATWPACVQDAKCAVRWMRANAEKYPIDPERIAAIGGSAGGHLAMMLGYSAGVPELEGDGGHEGYSSAVQAVVNFYGPTDLTVERPERDHPLVLGLFGGKRYDEIPDQYALASPMYHLDTSDPPTLTFHGTIDDLVPIYQADTLAEKLKELGIPSEYRRIEGYPHGMDMAREVNLHCQWWMNRFLEKHLRGTD